MCAHTPHTHTHTHRVDFEEPRLLVLPLLAHVHVDDLGVQVDLLQVPFCCFFGGCVGVCEAGRRRCRRGRRRALKKIVRERRAGKSAGAAEQAAAPNHRRVARSDCLLLAFFSSCCKAIPPPPTFTHAPLDNAPAAPGIGVELDAAGRVNAHAARRPRGRGASGGSAQLHFAIQAAAHKFAGETGDALCRSLDQAVFV